MLETYLVFSETNYTITKHFFSEEAALAYLSSIDDKADADLVVLNDELPF